MVLKNTNFIVSDVYIVRGIAPDRPSDRPLRSFRPFLYSLLPGFRGPREAFFRRIPGANGASRAVPAGGRFFPGPIEIRDVLL